MIKMFWVVFIGALVLVLLVIPGAVIWRRAMKIPLDTDRRRFLKKAAAYPVGLVAAGTYGSQYERCHTVDNRYTIKAEAGGFPAGFRLAQISDVHLGRFFDNEDLRQLLARIAADGPDMLVITGDLFDDERLNPDAARVLEDFVDAFPDGIWFCLGNHEHFRGVEKIQADLAKTRVHALYNKAVKVPGRDFWLAGVDYPMLREEKKFQQLKAKFTENALADIPAEERPRTILLAHHPEFIDDAAAAGVLLTLTGHTHGCQFGVLGLPLFPVFKYNRGLVKKGTSYGYVHSGNGSWFPCRIGCPPEIAYFTVQ